MKNILHISDLHLSDHKLRGFNFKHVESLIETLIRDISSVLGENIDSVFLTGDITFSGLTWST